MVQRFFVFVRSVDRKINAPIGCRFLSGDFYARTRIYYKECEVESENVRFRSKHLALCFALFLFLVK